MARTVRLQRSNSAAALERLALLIGVILAIIVIGCGVFLAHHLDDSHWINRAGAAVVALQVCAAMIEFARRNRLRHAERAMLIKLTHHSQASTDELHAFMEHEVQKSESHAFLVVMSLAAGGELLHGFGDMLFEMIVH